MMQHLYMTMTVLIGQPTPESPGGGLGGSYYIVLIAGLFFIMYMLVMRPEKQKARQRQEMLKQLKKNDKVVTNGGIIGTIVDVKDDEVVLKVDENTNTKIRVGRWAIHEVLKESKEGETKRS